MIEVHIFRNVEIYMLKCSVMKKFDFYSDKHCYVEIIFLRDDRVLDFTRKLHMFIMHVHIYVR